MILGNMIPPAIFRHVLEQAMTDYVHLHNEAGEKIGESRAQVVAHDTITQIDTLGMQTVFNQLADVSMPVTTDIPAGTQAVKVTGSQQPALIGTTFTVLAEAHGAAGGAVRVLRCRTVGIS